MRMRSLFGMDEAGERCTRLDKIAIAPTSPRSSSLSYTGGSQSVVNLVLVLVR